MKTKTRPLALLIALAALLTPALRSEETVSQRQELTVDGVAREFLVFAPAKAKTEAAPLVFGWHGHGGNMNQSARSYHVHTLWPEAIVVYPQGLNTPGKLTDPEGKKPGWQHGVGAQGDRDLKFFDAMLADIRSKYKVDERRIYSTGHSNGGGFTYLLMAERSEVFTAFAPSAAAANANRDKVKPKPVLHIAGENDPLVKYAWQTAMIEALRKLNQCEAGKPWELDANCTFYPSKIGAPLVTAIHPGDHKYPEQAPEVIVKFFKSQVKPAVSQAAAK
jgi:polyhydroxybutyrate depolymerase